MTLSLQLGCGGRCTHLQRRIQEQEAGRLPLSTREAWADSVSGSKHGAASHGGSVGRAANAAAKRGPYPAMGGP